MKIRINEQFLISVLFLLVFVCGVLWTPAIAKTRWSALHLVPDADFLSGGQIVVDVDGYNFADSAKGQTIRPTGLLNFGIMEWVNVEAGYAGGFTLGFKARLLGENGNYMPSLAIGSRNIISSKESNYFKNKDSINDTLSNAFYLALAKSFDPIRLRFSAGLLTIPTSKNDQIDPFFALEEYCGAGLYVTLEVERLKGVFLPSLFASWRILKKKLEISAGAIAINKLFFDNNNKFNVSLTSSDATGFVRPGIWFGLRFKGNIPLGKNTTFSSIDDHVKAQGESIERLKTEIDSLKTTLSENMTRMARVDNSIMMLSDSIYSDRNRLKAALYDKLVALKILYESEPFEPEQVRQSIAKIVAVKDNALPILKEYLLDKKQDRKIRLLCISLIGEMSGTGASDALLDVLSQSEDPDIKIEILIALGKMKETRALYVMEQLANDPIDVVAFTAQEVLQKLVKEKGVKLSADFKMRPVSMSESSIIKEDKIPVQKMESTPAKKNVTPDTKPLSSMGKTKPALNDSITPKGIQVKTPAADSSKGSAREALPLKNKPAAGNNSSDIWGIRGAGKDSSVVSQLKKDTVQQPGFQPKQGTWDSVAAVKKDNQAIPIDSASSSTAGQVKKDEQAMPSPNSRKEKASKKKKASVPSAPEDKNW
jgi:hypothetical protein